jgi:hypothetical protein
MLEYQFKTKKRQKKKNSEKDQHVIFDHRVRSILFNSHNVGRLKYILLIKFNVQLFNFYLNTVQMSCEFNPVDRDMYYIFGGRTYSL